MKTNSLLNTALATTVFLLAGTCAAAQHSPTTKNLSPHSAPATHTSAAGKTSASAAINHGANGGNNPMYEPKDKAAPHPGPASSHIQPYKDPEDMTTRYRPGNNKTTKPNPGVKIKTAPAPPKR